LAQKPLSEADALKQIYHEYDDSKKTAQWKCTREDDSHCWKGEYATVSIRPLLMAGVNEDGVQKTYVIASAKPAHPPLSYDCHSCAPAIGGAVFFWQSDRWHLQSVNPATGFFGSWGEPGDVDFVSVGPNLHGFLISTDFGGQGYYEASKTLLVSVGGTVKEVWKLQDEQDDIGAYDPTDIGADHTLYRSSAGVRFFADNEQHEESRDYYEIEVISRGRDRRGKNNTMRQQNWTEIYRFSAGRYQLLSRKDFTENQKKRSPTHPR
jgi:hypothetical protein